MVPEWLRSLFSPPEEDDSGGDVPRRPTTTVAMLSRPHGRNGVSVCEAGRPVKRGVLIARPGLWAGWG